MCYCIKCIARLHIRTQNNLYLNVFSLTLYNHSWPTCVCWRCDVKEFQCVSDYAFVKWVVKFRTIGRLEVSVALVSSSLYRSDVREYLIRL